MALTAPSTARAAPAAASVATAMAAMNNLMLSPPPAKQRSVGAKVTHPLPARVTNLPYAGGIECLPNRVSMEGKPMLQALVHHGVLKGVCDQHGGYKIGRHHDRISAEDILRAATDEIRRESGARASRLDQQSPGPSSKSRKSSPRRSRASVSRTSPPRTCATEANERSFAWRLGAYAGRVAGECKPGSAGQGVGLGVARAAIRCYMGACLSHRPGSASCRVYFRAVQNAAEECRDRPAPEVLALGG
jgi:hypothetical protein